jgi:hypothetical protein
MHDIEVNCLSNSFSTEIPFVIYDVNICGSRCSFIIYTVEISLYFTIVLLTFISYKTGLSWTTPQQQKHIKLITLRVNYHALIVNKFPLHNFLLLNIHVYMKLEFRGGKPPLILVARFARTNVAEYVR